MTCVENSIMYKMVSRIGYTNVYILLYTYVGQIWYKCIKKIYLYGTTIMFVSFINGKYEKM